MNEITNSKLTMVQINAMVAQALEKMVKPEEIKKLKYGYHSTEHIILCMFQSIICIKKIEH
jgi:hypothetical protein